MAHGEAGSVAHQSVAASLALNTMKPGQSMSPMTRRGMGTPGHSLALHGLPRKSISPGARTKSGSPKTKMSAKAASAKPTSMATSIGSRIANGIQVPRYWTPQSNVAHRVEGEEPWEEAKMNVIESENAMFEMSSVFVSVIRCTCNLECLVLLVLDEDCGRF